MYCFRPTTVTALDRIYRGLGVTYLPGNLRAICTSLFSKQKIRTAVKMSSTSVKHRNFVGEPMGDKPVRELAGIGDVLGGKLEEAGFDKAYVVLGQFLVFRKDEELFKEWLKETTGANKKQSGDCYTCLKEWCDSFL